MVGVPISLPSSSAVKVLYCNSRCEWSSSSTTCSSCDSLQPSNVSSPIRHIAVVVKSSSDVSLCWSSGGSCPLERTVHGSCAIWCVVRSWKVTFFVVLAARSDGFHPPSVLPVDIDVFGVPCVGNIPGRCTGQVPEPCKVGFHVLPFFGSEHWSP